jgi:2-oxoglutarate/2-oxoacid ferredoxin oxidoreductase subunit beta
MSTETNPTPLNGNGSTTATAPPPDATLEFIREKVTKKAVTADHPTWCPGCGDFAVLASYYKVIE